MAAAEHEKAMSLLMGSAKYSDLSLLCGGHEFPVHRAIEANTRRIDLKDDEPETVQRMISFMYTFDYKDEQCREPESVEVVSLQSPPEADEEDLDAAVTGEDEALSVPVKSSQESGVSGEVEGAPTLFSSVRVYAIADKYDIPLLKELAKKRFCEWAKDNWACADFPAIVREVFESTPSSDRGLRDLVLELVANHADALIEKDDLLSAVESIGELGLGLFCQLSSVHQEEKSALESVVEGLENEIVILKQQLSECQQNLLEKSDELDSNTSKIKDLVDCWHCGSKFNLELRDDLTTSISFRCKRCKSEQ